MKIRYFLFLLPFMVWVSCTINRMHDEKTVVVLNKNGTETNMLISLTKGSEWAHQFKPGPFIINVYPQIVFWMESPEGDYFETLYVTGADGKGFRNATKKQLGEGFYKMCFPVWADRMKKAGQNLPSKETPYTDALTSATPQSSFDLDIHTGPLSTPLVFYAEINKSMDYNQTYTKENSDWMGQPSVLYSVRVDSVVHGSVYPMKLAGYCKGSVGNPEISTDFKPLDTALTLVQDIQVSFQ